MILSKILKIWLTRDLKIISRAKKFCVRKNHRGDPYDFFSRAPIRNFGGVFVHVCPEPPSAPSGALGAGPWGLRAPQIK